MKKRTKIRKKIFRRFHIGRRIKPHRGYYSKKRKSARKVDKIMLACRKFERNVNLVLEHIFPNVDANVMKSLSDCNVDSIGQAILKQEMARHHSGFKRAQNILIDLILSEQNTARKLKVQSKGTKNRNVKSILKAKLDFCNYKLDVYRHLADTIFWLLIGGKLHLARRFYHNVPGEKDLIETNYESVLSVAKEINATPLNFVLLTDITSYVQLGDLVGIVDGRHTVIEVKEGKRNHEMLNDIVGMLNSQDELKSKADRLWSKYSNSKDAKQLSRMLKQMSTAYAEIGIMNSDKGKDPVSGKNISISTPKLDTEYYDDKLHLLELQLHKRKRWAYDVVEGCLHIGLYRDQMRGMGPFIFDSLAKDIEHKYIIDARLAFKALGTPIFCWPFSKELIMDIIMGRTLMLMMLDMDKFMKLLGDTCCFASRSETTKIIESYNAKALCIFDNKAIKYGKDVFLSPGAIDKILFSHISPHYMAYALLNEYQES